MATLKETLDAKRNEAEKAENLEVAKQIWQTVSMKLQSFLDAEYARLEYIGLSICIKDHDLVLTVNIKDGLTQNITRQDNLTQVIRFSKEKLEELDIIMYIAMRIAEKEGIETWHDNGEYAETYDARSWGFMWYNDNIEL